MAHKFVNRDRCWSQSFEDQLEPGLVRQRFAYKHPGLYVFPARVYRMPRSFDLIETPAYAGCKSWVELEQDVPTDGAVPVLDDAAFQDVLRKLDLLLNPTAFA